VFDLCTLETTASGVLLRLNLLGEAACEGLVGGSAGSGGRAASGCVSEELPPLLLTPTPQKETRTGPKACIYYNERLCLDIEA